MIAALFLCAATSLLPEGKEFKLVWSDEFNGTSLDRTKWGFETGFVRNREYQYYTDRQEKAKSPNGYYCGGMSKLEGVTPTDGFHVYAAEWTEKGVTMFYDGRPYGRYSFDAYDQNDGTNCFRKPHFILVNLALGAEWMMPKAQMTKDFPVRYEIDWIRVYAPSVCPTSCP